MDVLPVAWGLAFSHFQMGDIKNRVLGPVSLREAPLHPVGTCPQTLPIRPEVSPVAPECSSIPALSLPQGEQGLCGQL